MTVPTSADAPVSTPRQIFALTIVHLQALLYLLPDKSYFNVLTRTDEKKNEKFVCPASFCGSQFGSKKGYVQHFTSKASKYHRQMLQDIQPKLLSCPKNAMLYDRVDFRNFPLVVLDQEPQQPVFEPPFEPPQIENYDNVQTAADEQAIFDKEAGYLFTEKVTEGPLTDEQLLFIQEDIKWSIFIDDLLGDKKAKSTFFDIIENDLSKVEREHFFFIADTIMTAKAACQSPFETYSGILRPLISTLMDYTDKMLNRSGASLASIMSNDTLKTLLVRFAKSSYLQDRYQLKYYCCSTASEPAMFKNDVTGSEVELGRFINPETILNMVFGNASLVQHIATEAEDKAREAEAEAAAAALPGPSKKPRTTIPDSFTWDSLLTCSKERLEMIKGTLQLIFGIDDFSVKTRLYGEHKYCMVYLSIGNIHIKHRLGRKSIYLLAIGNRKIMKENNATFNDFMRPLIDKLKPLFKNGVPVTVQRGPGQPSTEVNIKLSLAAVCCDNLGRHEVGGYRAYFGDYHLCAMCGLERDDYGHITDASFCPLRGNPEHVAEYEIQVIGRVLLREKIRELMRTGDFTIEEATEAARNEFGFNLHHDHDGKKPLLGGIEDDNPLGLADDCIFLELSPDLTIYNFLTPDICHDLLEGILPTVLELILNKIKMNISPQQIVDKINEFAFVHGKIIAKTKDIQKSFGRKPKVVSTKPNRRNDDDLVLVTMPSTSEPKVTNAKKTKKVTKKTTGKQPQKKKTQKKKPVPKSAQPKKFKMTRYWFPGAKATQKAELFMRFPQLFYKHIIPNQGETTVAMNLYSALRELCVIVFKYSLTEKEREQLPDLAGDVITYMNTLKAEFKATFTDLDDTDIELMLEDDEEDQNPENQREDPAAEPQLMRRRVKLIELYEMVTSKVHMVVHYYDLIAYFGPLNWFSTLSFERRHYTVKCLYALLGCYMNVPFTLCNRQQMSAAIHYRQSGYADQDFFAKDSDPGLLDEQQFQVHTGFNVYDVEKLKSRHYPFPVNKKIVRQVLSTSSARNPLYLEPCSFHRTRDGVIYAYGRVYEWHCINANTYGVQSNLLNVAKSRLVPYSASRFAGARQGTQDPAMKYVALSGLNYKNDYYFEANVQAGIDQSPSDEMIFLEGLL